MKTLISAFLLCDGYKTCHPQMYPQGMSKLLSNFTCRNDKYYREECTQFYTGKQVFVGLQGALKEINETFDVFFKTPKRKMLKELSTFLKEYKGGVSDKDLEFFSSLHDVGYLPIEVRALEEGSLVKIGVPLFTVESTNENLSSIVNTLETAFSALTWKSIHTATLSKEFHDISMYYLSLTDKDNTGFVWVQNHDFSMRGMSGVEDAARTGFAYLTSSLGSDTLPAIHYANQYYPSLTGEKVFPTAISVNATEHSISCSNIGYLMDKFSLNESQAEKLFLDLLLDKFPSGILSYVSDTYDYFYFITEILRSLKEKIVRRGSKEGLNKLVVRPDSGDPFKIICGDETASVGSPEYKGSVEILWEIFGGSVNSQGYKVLHPAIGLIYGDSITRMLSERVLLALKEKGFASSNIVFGVGSYSLNYTTRDVFGIAFKATNMQIEGKEISLQKRPKTDLGKKSIKGLPLVYKEGENFFLKEGASRQEFEGESNELKVIYKNSKFIRQTDLDEIRLKISS